MPRHVFIVRSVVSDPAQRAAFDAWYRDDHLPKAVAAFGAEKAWRSWSTGDPAVHHAGYQFADRAALDRAVGSARMQELIAEFDRDWPQVERSRDILAVAQEWQAPA
jgi:hypothetical protein